RQLDRAEGGDRDREDQSRTGRKAEADEHLLTGGPDLGPDEAVLAEHVLAHHPRLGQKQERDAARLDPELPDSDEDRRDEQRREDADGARTTTPRPFSRDRDLEFEGGVTHGSADNPESA